VKNINIQPQQQSSKALSFAAVAAIQAATLPAIQSVLFNDARLPLAMPALLLCGLSVLFVQAIKARDVVYTIANGCGVLGNWVLLVALLLK